MWSLWTFECCRVVVVSGCILLGAACASRPPTVPQPEDAQVFPEVRQITFTGNTHFSSGTLRKVMATQQRPLLIHCHAGVGRTGTILHLYYLAQGRSWDEAKAKIRATRVQCLLLADEQIAFLRAYTATSAS